MRRHACFFTLIEVMIAAGILAMSVAATLAIVGGARARLLRAEKRWGWTHILSQAAEYFLLAGPKGDEVEELLPEGFSADCELLEIDDLPEEAVEPINSWILGTFRIRVFDLNGEVLGEVFVDKLVKEDDL